MTLADNFETQFERFNRDNAAVFEGFNRRHEQAFNDSFKAQWQSFNEALVDPLPLPPKPLLQPKQEPLQVTRTQGPEHKPPAPVKFVAPTSNNGFYGHRVLRLSLAGLPRLAGKDPEALLEFRRQALASPDFNELIALLGFMQQRLRTDSYSTLALAQHLCENYFPENNPQLACSWVLGQTQGLDVRVASRQQQLLVLTPSSQQWYEQPFFKVDGMRLYVINDHQYRALNGPTSLQTTRHEDATTPTRVGLSSSFLPAQVNMVPARHFGLALQLDRDYVAWLYQLPLLTVEDYLKDALPAYLQQQMSDYFAATANSMTAFRGVLSDLQNWPYMVDQEQFGREKPLTFSESLYFPYSDCEDRVYALAVISQTFLNMPIAGLRFPNHLSAAVQVGNVWQEADPTYLGASLGMRQPLYRGLEPDWFYP